MYGPQRRRLILTIAGVMSAVAAIFVVIRHMRRNPSASSHRRREGGIPRPFLTRDELRKILVPSQGEDLLEVGPGKGYYSLAVAEEVSPDGTLTILDVQAEMLEHTMSEARSRGGSNITPILADATNLPFPNDSFDGAYLVAVLGEVPDKETSVRELQRVVKPGGRIVFGEAITDPHRVLSGTLRSLGEKSGLRFEREIGGLLGTFYRFSV